MKGSVNKIKTDIIAEEQAERKRWKATEEKIKRKKKEERQRKGIIIKRESTETAIKKEARLKERVLASLSRKRKLILIKMDNFFN
jgi:6-phosphofructokinase